MTKTFRYSFRPSGAVADQPFPLENFFPADVVFGPLGVRQL